MSETERSATGRMLRLRHLMRKDGHFTGGEALRQPLVQGGDNHENPDWLRLVQRPADHHEIHRTANPARPPLVPLHGGGDAIATSFGRLLPALVCCRRCCDRRSPATGRLSPLSSRATATRPISPAVRSPSNNRRTTPPPCSSTCVSARPISSISATAVHCAAGRDPASAHCVQAGGGLGLLPARRRLSLVLGRHAHAPAREHPAELQQACFAVAPLSRNLRMMHDQAAPRMPGLQDIPAAIHGIAVSVLVPAGYLARRARGSGPDQPVERHSSASCSISIAPDWSRSLRAAFSRRPETR